MSENVKAPEGHVVAAKVPGPEESGVASALFAVVADSPEEAATAVQDLVPTDTEVLRAGRCPPKRSSGLSSTQATQSRSDNLLSP